MSHDQASIRSVDRSEETVVGSWQDRLADNFDRNMRAQARRRRVIRAVQRTGVPRLTQSIYEWRLGPHIRVVNYHDIAPEHADNFKQHIEYYATRFQPVGLEDLRSFLAGANTSEFRKRPGLIVSFDDGFDSHVTVAAPVLDHYGFIGWFFVPTDAPDVPGSQQERWAKDHAVVPEATSFGGRQVFATWDQVRDLADDHVVGSHTASHQRLGPDVDPALIAAELNESADRLTTELNNICEAFCWVGGEVEAYSAAAQRQIEGSRYEFAFRTCSKPVTEESDPLAIERTNIEADYTLSEVRFQLSGLTDLRYLRKREFLAARLASAS